MAEISSLGDYGEVKIPSMLDVMSKQAQTEKYNLDVAGSARNFFALKQYGEGAARGDPEATIQLNSKNPEAGNILANIGKTAVETKQAKENLVKGAAARVAQTASQFSDPAQQTQVFHNGIDLLLSQNAISQAEADNYKHMASVDPQGMIRGIIHGNLSAAQTPVVAGQVAQREAEGRLPSESKLARQRGSYQQPHVYEREVPDPDNPGKTKIERGYVNPVLQPGADSPGGAPTIDQFGNPIRPGSGSSSGPGTVRTSGVTTSPSTYIPDSGGSLATMNVPDEYKGTIADAASKHGVPEELLTRVLHAESGFNPNAVGPMTKYGTAKGIGQFIDSTAKSRGVNAFDPESAIPGAAAYLAEEHKKTGSWQGALTRYLGGSPKPGSSYFRSGAIQLARRLDTKGAAPPAPGSTAAPPESSTIAVPPPDTSRMPSTAPAPEPPPLSSTTGPRSEVEPEALSGGSGGPVPTTAPGAGEDTTSPASSYDTPATTPSSTTLSGADRGGGAPPGTWTPAPSQSALEAEKEKVTNPLKTQQHRDISDIDIAKQDKINRMEYEKEEAKGLLGIGDKEYADASTQAKESLPARIHLNQLRSILESGETMGPTADKRKAIMSAVVEASALLGVGNVPEWKQTVAMQKLFQSIGTQLGFDMVKSLGSREAMQVVAQVMSIKPSTLHTNEENRVIINSLDQAFRIMQEKQKFFEDYRAKHMDEVKKSGKYSTGFYGAQRAFDETQSVHKLASEVVPYQPKAKDKMIDGVTYDMSYISPGYKGVWDSKKGSYENVEKIEKY